MKYIFTLLLTSLFFITGCNKETQTLDSNKAYMFYSQTCPHCHEAQEYIKKKYPTLDITKIDVATSNGKEMLFECAQKFNLGNRLGVPLFCLGDNYIMGWSDTYRIKFDAYIRPFMKK